MRNNNKKMLATRFQYPCLVFKNKEYYLQDVFNSYSFDSCFTLIS